MGCRKNGYSPSLCKSATGLVPSAAQMASASLSPDRTWTKASWLPSGDQLASRPSGRSWAAPCLALAHGLLVALHAFLTVLAAPSWASLALPAPPVWALALALAGVAWLLAPPGWPLRWSGASWLLPMLLWPAARPAEGDLWVTALDVGQGMAVLVESKSHALLYDTGPRFSGSADAGGRIVLPYLRWRGIEALDLLVVSHLDSDHSGGARSILRGVPVAAVLSSVDASHPALLGADAAQRCEAGQQFDLGPLRVEVLRRRRPNTRSRGWRPTPPAACCA